MNQGFVAAAFTAFAFVMAFLCMAITCDPRFDHAFEPKAEDEGEALQQKRRETLRRDHPLIYERMYGVPHATDQH